MFISFSVLAFISAKPLRENSKSRAESLFFTQQKYTNKQTTNKKNPSTLHLSSDSLLLVVFFLSALSFCHMLRSPSAAPADTSTSLKSHCCILNYPSLITSPLLGDGMLLKKKKASLHREFIKSAAQYASMDSLGRHCTFCCPCFSLSSCSIFFFFPFRMKCLLSSPLRNSWC